MFNIAGGDWLFRQYVLSRLYGLDQKRRVLLDGNGNQDGLDLRVRKKFPVIGVTPAHARLGMVQHAVRNETGEP